MYKGNKSIIGTIVKQKNKDKPLLYLDVEVTHKDIEDYLEEHRRKGFKNTNKRENT